MFNSCGYSVKTHAVFIDNRHGQCANVLGVIGIARRLSIVFHVFTVKYRNTGVCADLNIRPPTRHVDRIARFGYFGKTASGSDFFFFKFIGRISYVTRVCRPRTRRVRE